MKPLHEYSDVYWDVIRLGPENVVFGIGRLTPTYQHGTKVSDELILRLLTKDEALEIGDALYRATEGDLTTS